MIVGHLWVSSPRATVLLDVDKTGTIVSGPPYARDWAIGKPARAMWDSANRYPKNGELDERATYAVWINV